MKHFPANDPLKDSAIADMMAELMTLAPEARFHTVFRKMIEEVYSRMVPDMDEFLFSEEFLGFSKRQLYPRVRDVLYIIDRDDVREAYIVAGKGSGKSVIVGISQLRQLFKLLCYVQPAAYFELLPGTYIALVNMSINSSQALNVIFKRFVSYLDKLDIFKKLSKQAIVKYKKSEKDKEFSLHDFNLSENLSKYELFSETVGMITFPDKDIVVMSGHSKATAFFGYDIFFGSVDEMSWFESGKERIKDMESLPSEEIFQGLSASGLSRFPKAYKVVAISSPRSRIGDPLWKKFERIKNIGSVFEVL